MTALTHLPGGTYPLHLVSHLEEHLRWMRRRGLSPRTVRSRRRVMVLLAEQLGADPVDATVGDLEAWQESLPSLQQVRWCTAMIRPYFRYLHQRGLRPDDPAALLATPRKRRRLPRPVAEAKVEAMLDRAPARLLPWLLLAGWSGLRAGEIAALRVEDFFADRDGRRWADVTGKGGHQRHVPIPAWCWRIIAAELPAEGCCFRRVRGPGAGVEPVTAQHVSQYSCAYLHEIGIEDSLHSLRHRVATLTYARSRDLRLVQDLLGHADQSTTAQYTRVTPSGMADAVEALPVPRLPLEHQAKARPTRQRRVSRSPSAGRADHDDTGECRSSGPGHTPRETNG